MGTTKNGRRERLAPYVAQLSLDASGSVPEEVSFAGHGLAIDTWERRVLQDALTGDQIRSWSPLVAQGIAFQLCCVARFAEVAQNGGVGELVSEMVTDAAIGLSLQEEIQRDIDHLIIAGQIDEAKKFTAFRNKLGQSIARIKDRVGSDAFSEAETRCVAFIAPSPPKEVRAPEPDRPLLREEDEGFRGDPARYAPKARIDQEPEEQRSPSRVGRLVVFLGLAVVVWVYLTLSRDTYVGPPELALEQFDHVSGVVAITARPPSLFAEVGTLEWNDLSHDERFDLLVQIGVVADQAGYSGAQVRTTGGRPVGQWLKEGGARILEGPTRIGLE